MYRVASFEDGRALVVNVDIAYESSWLADSAEAAEALVVGLNQPDLLEALAKHRYEFETAGLAVADGLILATDRESQGQLRGAHTDLKDGLIPDTSYKANNGWQTGTLDDIRPLARALAVHVRGCFKGECAVNAAISAASTMAEIEAIDIQAQFMAAYQAAVAEVITPEQAPE